MRVRTEDEFHKPYQEIARNTFGKLLDRMQFNVIGQENLQFLRNPEQTARETAIFAFFPHTTHVDSPVVRWAIPADLRINLIYPAAADCWYKGGLIGYVMGVMSSLAVPNFPMQRGSGSTSGIYESLDIAQNFLQRYSLVMSFEGTRSNLPNDRRQFHTGGAELAIRSGRPIIPVALVGLEQVLPKGRALPSFRENGEKRIVKVSFGKAIEAPVAAGNRSRLRKDFTEHIREESIKLCLEAREV